MEGLVEIQQAQSSGSLNTVNTGSTMSLKKVFGSMMMLKKSKNYDSLESDSESVKSFASGKSKLSTKSGKSTATRSSGKSHLSSTNSTKTQKSIKGAYSMDRFSGPKHVPSPSGSKTGGYNSKSYHEACWSQAYAFGGR
eukprot:gene19433-21356_t